MTALKTLSSFLINKEWVITITITITIHIFFFFSSHVTESNF